MAAEEWPDRRIDPQGYIAARNKDIAMVLDDTKGVLDLGIDTLMDETYDLTLDGRMARNLLSASNVLLKLGQLLLTDIQTEEIVQLRAHAHDQIAAGASDELMSEVEDFLDDASAA